MAMTNGHSNNNATAHEHPSTKLRRLIEISQDIIVAPGVYDGFSARIALEVGFPCLYMTGAGTVAAKLGQPDLGLATLNDMRFNAEIIANLDPNIPLIADADTGYGGPNMVARTVAAYHRSNVAGLHIEDQIQTKRCGHLNGKIVVDEETFLSRIRAAVQARKRIGSDMVIIARTDTLQTHDFQEAVKRLKSAAEAGADVAFLEGLTSDEECRIACREIGIPALLNMVEHGATPSYTPAQARELGFRIIIFPFAGIAPAYKSIKETYERIKVTGETGLEAEFTPKKLFEIVGLKEAMEVDVEAGGALYKKV